MATFRNLAIGFILIGLFIYSFLNFGILFADSNNLNISIEDNDAINGSFGDISTELRGSTSDLEANRKSISGDIPEDDADTLGITSIVGVVTSMFNLFFRGIFDVSRELIKKTLGIENDILFAATTCLFIISAILLAWQAWRSGR